MIKKFTLSVCAAIACAMSASATDYFVKVDGTGAGTSWEDAMNFATFYNTVSGKQDGEYTFYFAAGTYTQSGISSTNNTVAIKATCTLIGGFATNLTGTAHETPDYSTAQRTIFSGEASTDNGGRILSINTSTKDDSKPVLIQGIDFTKSSSLNPSETMGALFLDNSGKVEIKNCDFYENSTEFSYGGQALLSYRSTAYLTECMFHDNTGKKGGAIRLKSNDKTKGKTYFDRCAIYNNSVENATGSAICVQHGVTLCISNSTVYGNSAASGGAIYVNGSSASFPDLALYVINSTIAGNTGGNQIQMSQGAKLKIANSIVVGNEDDGTTAKAAVAITGATESPDYFDVTIDANNLLGSFADEVAAPTKTPAGDGYAAMSKENTFATAFGSNTFADGSITPLFHAGATLAQLATIASEWGVPSTIDLTVDQKGTARADDTSLGAIAVKDSSTGINGVVSSVATDNVTYNLQGVKVSSDNSRLTKGVYIRNGKKFVVR